MNWIIYAFMCIILYGVMQFFIKLSSVNNNPVVSSMYFITAQFAAQILIGAYLISKTDININYEGIKYGILGGILAAVATIFFFLAVEQAPLSRVVPFVNMSVIMVAVVISVIFLKEEITIKIIAGIILAIASIYLLTNTE